MIMDDLWCYWMNYDWWSDATNEMVLIFVQSTMINANGVENKIKERKRNVGNQLKWYNWIY